MKLIEFGKKGKMNVVVGSVGVSRTPFFKWPLPWHLRNIWEGKQSSLWEIIIVHRFRSDKSWTQVKDDYQYLRFTCHFEEHPRRKRNLESMILFSSMNTYTDHLNARLRKKVGHIMIWKVKIICFTCGREVPTKSCVPFISVASVRTRKIMME